MKCPICNIRCSERTRTAFKEIDGKKWVYEYREFVCPANNEHTWQDEAQMQDNLDAIKKVNEAAARLKKAQP